MNNDMRFFSRSMQMISGMDGTGTNGFVKYILVTKNRGGI